MMERDETYRLANDVLADLGCPFGVQISRSEPIERIIAQLLHEYVMNARIYEIYFPTLAHLCIGCRLSKGEDYVPDPRYRR